MYESCEEFVDFLAPGACFFVACESSRGALLFVPASSCPQRLYQKPEKERRRASRGPPRWLPSQQCF